MESEARALFVVFMQTLQARTKFLRHDLSVSEEVFQDRARQAEWLDEVIAAAQIALKEVG